MEHTAPGQRLYAALLGTGACILLVRTTLLIAQGYLTILLSWVAALLLLELALDLGCIRGSIRWLVAGDEARARLPLRLGFFPDGLIDQYSTVCAYLQGRFSADHQ